MRLHNNYSGLLHTVTLIKNSEKYIFRYDDESSLALRQALGRFAGDPHLSFSWYDAAVLSKRTREDIHEREQKRKRIQQKRDEGLKELQNLLQN